VVDEGTNEVPSSVGEPTPIGAAPATPWWQAHSAGAHSGSPTPTPPGSSAALSVPAATATNHGDETPGKPGSKRSLLSSKRFRLASLVLVVAVLGGFVGGLIVRGDSSSISVSKSNASPGAALLPNGTSVPSLVDHVLPTVVSIDARGQSGEAQGTGMIISADGNVLTNNHVIALAAASGGTITVTRSGSTTALDATLVGRDPSNDVALIKINNASNLPTVTMANSDKVVVGDAAVAIGNALGLAAGTPTVTTGIVSALGRTVTASTEEGTGSETLTNLIQTDAAINPGNSGGPLLDSAGDVIGMNTAVAGSSTGSAQNIGFAIPSNRLTSLVPELQKGGTSTARTGGYMGVEITTLTESLRSQYNLVPSSGAVILAVTQGSPAAKAGLAQGEVIIAIEGKKVSTADDVIAVTKSHRPGESVKVTVQQGTKVMTKTVVLGTPPN